MKISFKKVLVTVLLIPVVGFILIYIGNDPIKKSFVEPKPGFDAVNSLSNNKAQLNTAETVTQKQFKAPNKQKPGHQVEDYLNSKAFQRYSSGPEFLRPYFNIRQKALPTKKDLHDLEDLLADSATIEKSLSVLFKASPSFNEYQEKDRIMAIKFLKHSVSWKDNPKQEVVLNKIEEYLENSRPPKSADIQTKKSMAGDKVELFLALYEVNKIKAEELLQNTNNKKNQRLFKYALKQYKNI